MIAKSQSILTILNLIMQRITSLAELKEGTTYYMSNTDINTGEEAFKRVIKYVKASKIFKKKVLPELETDEIKYIDYQILGWQHVSCCKQFKDSTEPGTILDVIRNRDDCEILLKEKIHPFDATRNITDEMVWDRLKHFMDYPNGCPFDFSFEFVENKTFISQYKIISNIYVRNQKSVDKRYFVIVLINIGFEFIAADVLADEFYPRDVYDKSGIIKNDLSNHYKL